MVITTFDAPGAGTGAFEGTYPFAMNAGGDIVGQVTDGSDVCHGFIRFHDGTFVTFDAPGATHGTFAIDIANDGTVVGYYTFGSGTSNSGFIRKPDGTFITNLAFVAWQANHAYVIGDFVIDPSGHMQVVTIAGTSQNPGPPTWNDAGGNTIDGGVTWQDNGAVGAANRIEAISPSTGLIYGLIGSAQTTVFIAALDGSFGFVTTPSGIWGLSQNTPAINDSGKASLRFRQTSVTHPDRGFIINTDRSTVIYDAPGSGTGFGQGTQPWYHAVNAAGVIVGTYIDASGNQHIYIDDPTSGFSSVNFPVSTGTASAHIAPATAGSCCGVYFDSSNVQHGFLVTGLTTDQTIGGAYQDHDPITGSLVYYAFLLGSGGMTNFRVSGDGSMAGQGTIINGFSPIDADTGGGGGGLTTNCGLPLPNGNPLAQVICATLNPFSIGLLGSQKLGAKLNPISFLGRGKGRILVDLHMFKHPIPIGGLEVKALPFLVMEKSPQRDKTYKLSAVNYDDGYYAHDNDFIDGIVLYNGGDGAFGGGDGGTGDGNYRPSIYIDQGQLPTTDPEEAYDTFPDTFANISGTYDQSDGQQDDIITYTDFPNVVVHASTSLKIDFSLTINFAGVLQVWVNGSSVIHLTTTTPRNTVSVPIAAGTNIKHTTVQFFAVGTPSGTHNTAAICDLYDVYIVKV